MRTAIFSPSNGFLTDDKNWTSTPNKAAIFSAQDLQAGVNMPETPLSDARIVNVEHYSHESFEAITNRLAETVVDNLDGHAIADFVNTHTGHMITYLEDSLWQNTEYDALYTAEQLNRHLLDSFNEYTHIALAHLYNITCANIAYYDGDEGFYHQVVL